MKWNIDDVPVFAAVVDHGGITAAARALDMPKSTVSASLNRLETSLGLRLLDRNSRSVRVTGEGETFYRQAMLILEQVRETDAAMAGLTSRPSGKLTIALPPAFCQEILAPNLAAFRRHYPEVDLELVITGRGVDLVREQLDAAIVVGPQDDSELISKTLVSGPLLWVASPAYLQEKGLGLRFDPSAGHIQMIEKRYGLRRHPVQIDGHAAHLDLATGVIQVNDPLVVRRAVLNGAGISPLPQFYCQRYLDRGELVTVCDHVTFDPGISRLAVVYPSRRLMSPKVRAFLEFLNTVCRV